MTIDSGGNVLHSSRIISRGKYYEAKQTNTNLQVSRGYLQQQAYIRRQWHVSYWDSQTRSKSISTQARYLWVLQVLRKSCTGPTRWHQLSFFFVSTK